MNRKQLLDHLASFEGEKQEKLIDFFKHELDNDMKVKVAGIDTDGILRGKIMSKEKFFSSLKTGGFGYCSVIFEWGMHDKTYAPLSDGEVYGDLVAVIDLSSFRRVPWENNLPFFLVDFHDQSTGEALDKCPRGLLKRVIGQVKAVMGADCQPTAGVEFEFYNFQETSDSIRDKQFMNLKPLTQGMFGYSLLRPSSYQDYFDSIFDKCLEFGINLEALHTETGPGVYEVALRYNTALELADNAQLFKTSVKQLGILRPALTNRQPAIFPSFMAKPSSKLPGCSGHTHLSLMKTLLDGTKLNLFYDANDKWNMSVTMKQFIAGILTCLPVLMPIYAPNVNSYKRLVENYWAPVRVCWGLENRTASIRVISPAASGLTACSPESTRIEMRVPGSDINTHLVVAACFASGLYGIKNKLELSDPVMDEGKNAAERLPSSLGDAIEKMAESKLPREILGDGFVNHYLRSRREEWSKWEQAVTQYEVERYFELV